MKKNKKIILIIFIILLIIIGIIVFLLLNKKEEVNVSIKDDLDVEVNSELYLLSLVSEDNEVDIISEDRLIDTSILGEQELTIKYVYKKHEYDYSFNINIIDTESPVIDYKKEITVEEGTNIDLLKDVVVSDNSKEDITATIEGDYDINKVGTYNLKYIALDSSNNKTTEEFTLIVNEKPKEVINTNSYISNNYNTNTGTSNNTNTNNNNNTNSNSTNCSYYLDLYPSNKVYTSIPDSNPNLSWNAARFYVTKEENENGGYSYHLHNEKVSGHSIGAVAADSIRSIIGDYYDMKYTKDNPIILYQLGACY